MRCCFNQGLKLAREHDPLGIRTLGVVTKVDKAESGIANKLTASGSSALKLKLGFVAVRTSTHISMHDVPTCSQQTRCNALFCRQVRPIRQLYVMLQK